MKRVAKPKPKEAKTPCAEFLILVKQIKALEIKLEPMRRLSDVQEAHLFLKRYRRDLLALQRLLSRYLVLFRQLQHDKSCIEKAQETVNRFTHFCQQLPTILEQIPRKAIEFGVYAFFNKDATILLDYYDFIVEFCQEINKILS